jgi:CRP-like cAMP-binding protein
VEALQQAINSISPLSEESSKAFIEAWKYWKTPKDFFLLKENAVSDYIYFIKKGVARIYYYKTARNGDPLGQRKEITEWLALDEQFFLSITSFFHRTPSHLIIQTIEPSDVYGIHHDDFMELADKYHDVERLLRKMVTGSLILSQVRMDSIQFESAQQRYEKLLQRSPQIVQRVPLTYIASFLGITLETLSRIRSAR